MKKPIVKGCLAYITKAGYYPQYVWSQVVCEKFMGDRVGTVHTGKQAMVRNAWRVRLPDGCTIHCSEEALLRIDDPDIRKQLETEKIKEVDIVLET